MDILGLGVLLTGESGLGKSELGLELISRGHGLVADDAVDLYKISQSALEGRCPDLLLNLLEVRGIGLLDIKAIFGETAVRRKMRLKLIVHLVRKETMEREFERLPYEPLYEDILGIGAQGGDRGGRRPQPGGAGGGGGAQHHPAVARHRHLPGIHRAPPARDAASRGLTKPVSCDGGGPHLPLVRAGGLVAHRVQRQRVVLQVEAVGLGHGALALLDLGVVELLDAAAGQAHQVVVVLALVELEHRLADSKWLRDSSPACSNCISTRYTVARPMSAPSSSKAL